MTQPGKVITFSEPIENPFVVETNRETLQKLVKQLQAVIKQAGAQSGGDSVSFAFGSLQCLCRPNGD